MDLAQMGILLGAGPILSASTRKASSQLVKNAFDELETLLNAESFPNFEVQNTDAFLHKAISKLGAILESSPCTNAGIGSELNYDGKVECDASVIIGGSEGEEASASVGAVPDIESPIELCSRMIKQQIQPQSSTMLSTPSFLTGEGAYKYARRLGMRRGNLVTSRAQDSHRRWLALVKDSSQEVVPDKFIDTVGLIIFFRGRICVASSSGGSLLKVPGRLGPAAVVGRGLDLSESSAAVCSGFGEDIMSLKLAQKCVESEDGLENILERLTASRVKLQRRHPEHGVLKGMILSESKIDSSKVLFEWSHTTPSMICGFGGCVKSSNAKFKIVNSVQPASGGYVSSFDT